jgi:hypothetical protein
MTWHMDINAKLLHVAALEAIHSSGWGDNLTMHDIHKTDDMTYRLLLLPKPMSRDLPAPWGITFTVKAGMEKEDVLAVIKPRLDALWNSERHKVALLQALWEAASIA